MLAEIKLFQLSENQDDFQGIDMAIIKCLNCGTIGKSEQGLCDNCSAPLKKAPLPNTSPVLLLNEELSGQTSVKQESTTPPEPQAPLTITDPPGMDKRNAIAVIVGMILSILALGWFFSPADKAATTSPEPYFDAFESYRERIRNNFDCIESKTTPGSEAFGMGRLYGCVGGNARTVKMFVNEDPNNPGKIANIKLMWNEWTKDNGYGLTADKDKAKVWARKAAHMFAPAQSDEIVNTFMGKQSKSIQDAGSYRLTYRHQKGPAIDKHLLVIVPM